MEAGGLVTETSYPYVDEAGPVASQCKFQTAPNPAANITGGYHLYNGEYPLYQGLYVWGPISVMMQVIKSFQFYSSGIYKDTACTGQGINHAVLVSYTRLFRFFAGA